MCIGDLHPFLEQTAGVRPNAFDVGIWDDDVLPFDPSDPNAIVPFPNIDPNTGEEIIPPSIDPANPNPPTDPIQPVEPQPPTGGGGDNPDEFWDDLWSTIDP